MKNKLIELKYVDNHINDLLEELEKTEAKATKITSSLSDVPIHGNGNNDKLGNTVIKIIELKEQINREIDYYIDIRGKVIKRINELDPKVRNIFFKRYVLGKDFDVIAKELNYSYQYVINVHSKFFKKF